jgi:acyl-homoserine lactone synthase
MKVHIVTTANRARYSDSLRQMHEQRHRVFVEELGWQALNSAGGLEIDAYDDQHAVYMLAMTDGEVAGSARLLPSWRRSLTKDHLSNFIARDESFIAPDIWEWTRWAPGDSKQPRQLSKSRRALLLAGLEFGLSRGAIAFTAVCDPKIVTQISHLGWRPRQIGLPTQFAEGTAVAITWGISFDLLASTRRTFKAEGPSSFEAPASFAEEDIDAELIPQIMANVVSLNSRVAKRRIATTVRKMVADHRTSTVKYVGARQ